MQLQKKRKQRAAYKRSSGAERVFAAYAGGPKLLKEVNNLLYPSKVKGQSDVKGGRASVFANELEKRGWLVKTKAVLSMPLSMHRKLARLMTVPPTFEARGRQRRQATIKPVLLYARSKKIGFTEEEKNLLQRYLTNHSWLFGITEEEINNETPFRTTLDKLLDFYRDALLMLALRSYDYLLAQDVFNPKTQKKLASIAGYSPSAKKHLEIARGKRRKRGGIEEEHRIAVEFFAEDLLERPRLAKKLADILFPSISAEYYAKIMSARPSGRAPIPSF